MEFKIEKTNNRVGRNLYFIKRMFAKTFDTFVFILSFGYYHSNFEINVKFKELVTPKKN